MFPLLQKLLKKSQFKSISAKASREDWIFSGAILLFFIFLMVFIWGGYVFSRTREYTEIEPDVSLRKADFTVGDLDETVKLLDARDKKFKELLTK